MKTPNKTVLIGAIAAGAAVAGILSWLFLTEDGKEILDTLKSAVIEKGEDLFTNTISGKNNVNNDNSRTTTDSLVD